MRGRRCTTRIAVRIAAEDVPQALAAVRAQLQIAQITDALAAFYERAGKRRGDALVKRIMAGA